MYTSHPDDPRLAIGSLRLTLEVDCDAFDLPETLWVSVREHTSDGWQLRTSHGRYSTSTLDPQVAQMLAILVDEHKPLRLI